jgi:hypothetical protein
MTPKKTTPLVLMIFTLICALPVAAGAVPTAIAQVDEDDASLLDDDENLASGIVSNVLDGSSGDNDDDNEEENDDGGAAAGGDTNTQAAVPITDQDQEAANLALNEGVDVDVVQEEVQKETRTTPTPSEEEEPPEFVAFCFVSGLLVTQPLCFNTSEECEDAEEFLGDVTPNVSDCEGVETLSPNAINCVNARNEEGEVVTVVC